jgi:antitoxin component HigA of HigAB toxin-antitoxin module
MELGDSKADISRFSAQRAGLQKLLAGKRAISKARARTLAEFFNVSAELFI